MHLNSKLLFNKYATPYFKNGIKILEIGPSGSPSVYQKEINNPTIEWHTLDFVDTSFIGNAVNNLTYSITSPYSFPIADNVYDIVLSGQVIEHVQDIFSWLKEIRRIVKNGGVIITINPVSWPYHEAPIDCWRIYPSAIEVLAEKTELNIKLLLFESLEVEYIKKLDANSTFIPGKSYNYTFSEATLKKRIRWNKFIRKIPSIGKDLIFPIEVAFDTISILAKPNE